MTDYEKLNQIDFLPELAGANLHQKAVILQDFLKDTIFDETGLCYSILLIDGERSARPMNRADTRAINQWDEFGDDEMSRLLQEEAYTFENSLTTAGLYLTAQSRRYRVTGEEAALHEARRAASSIFKVYRFGVANFQPGWLCKPYGKKYSPTSTPDQYQFALVGLRTFYDIASETEREDIRRLFVDVADFSMQRNYQLTFTQTPWVMAQELYGYNAIYMLINLLAFEVSGEGKYMDEFIRLGRYGRWQQETYLQHWHDQGHRRMLLFERMSLPYFVIAPAEWMFEIIPAYFGARLSDIHARMEEIVARWYRFSLLGMNEDDIVHYWVDIDVDKGTWNKTGLTPLRPPEEANGGASEALFVRYYSDVGFGPNTYRQLYIALMAAQHCQGAVAEDARARVGRIMQKTDGLRLRWLIDPDGTQLLPELKWMSACLDSESPYLYLNVYWRGRQLGWW